MRAEMSKRLKFLSVSRNSDEVSCRKQHNFVFKMQNCKKN